MGQNQISKYEQKLFDSTKKSAMNALRTTLIRVIQKTEETTFDLVLNKIAEEITKTALKTTREDPSSSPSKIDGNISTVYQKRITYHQKADNKLFIKLNYYNYKYIARMKYQKIINLLQSINNQSSKFRIKSYDELNDGARRT